MKSNIRILGINVLNRQIASKEIQKILTRYGCSIKTRLGLNDFDEDTNGGGLILLELIGDENEWIKLENELYLLDGVEIAKMDFNKSKVLI